MNEQQFRLISDELERRIASINEANVSLRENRHETHNPEYTSAFGTFLRAKTNEKIGLNEDRIAELESAKRAAYEALTLTMLSDNLTRSLQGKPLLGVPDPGPRGTIGPQRPEEKNPNAEED